MNKLIAKTQEIRWGLIETRSTLQINEICSQILTDEFGSLENKKDLLESILKKISVKIEKINRKISFNDNIQEELALIEKISALMPATVVLPKGKCPKKLPPGVKRLECWLSDWEFRQPWDDNCDEPIERENYNGWGDLPLTVLPPDEVDEDSEQSMSQWKLICDQIDHETFDETCQYFMNQDDFENIDHISLRARHLNDRDWDSPVYMIYHLNICVDVLVPESALA